VLLVKYIKFEIIIKQFMSSDSFQQELCCSPRRPSPPRPNEYNLK